ncbi:MAG: hypothetical protein H7835_03555 [Magnetococcus sp. XQGC-1]
MDELSFIVQVSNGTPHCSVTIGKEGDKLTALCSCDSGGAGTLCKHRLSILSGQTKWVISDNIAGVKLVRSWVAMTDVGQTIIRMVRAQKRLQEAKVQVEAALQALRTVEEEAEAAEAEADAAKEELIQAIS